MLQFRQLPTLLDRVMAMVALPLDTAEERLRKAVLTLLSGLMIVPGTLWAIMYAALGLPMVAVIPLAHAIVSALGLAYFLRTRRYGLFINGELTSLMLLPFLLQWRMGGFVISGAVMLWAILAPLGALMFDPERRARGWILTFLALTLVSGIIDPYLHGWSVAMPEWASTASFVMNVLGVSLIFYALIRYFALALRQAEVLLMQQEKMAGLGTLAAGLAHELNNPAAAVQRSAAQMDDAVAVLDHSARDLSRLDQTPAEIDHLEHLVGSHAPGDPRQAHLLEEAVLEWLEDHAVPRAWELAPALASCGWDVAGLEEVTASLPAAHVPAVMRWMAARATVREVLLDIHQGSTQISEIVRAVKSYSYLDQGPLQDVDLHESLDSMLVILRHKLKGGVTVTRAYCDSLPCIEAYGSQLNQVWTNLVDNAADALNGQGTITLRTYAESHHVAVEIQDNGPGIPPQVLPRLFEPFFTTKGPGSGTGLGLYVAHDIVQKHWGRIEVRSVPGDTCFRVVLPIRRADHDSATMKHEQEQEEARV